MTALVWFKQDLRLLDNDAVLHACKNNSAIRFLVTPTLSQFAEHHWAAIKWDLYQRQLNELGFDLAELGHSLEVVKLDRFSQCAEFLQQYCAEQGITDVYFNRDYALDEVRRDKEVAETLQAKNDLTVHSFDSNLLVPPEQIKNGKGEYYKVFTPFFKVWLKYIREHGVPAPYPRSALKIEGIEGVGAYKTTELDLPKDKSNLPENRVGQLKSSKKWLVGEANLRKKTQEFVHELVDDYKAKRDFPAIDGTSTLSAYFEIGALSPRVAVHLLQRVSPEFPEGLSDGAYTWLSELAWREFYQHLMFHEPRLAMGEPFQAEQSAFPWVNDKVQFVAWSEGRTGFPIVDAGMRQLNATGWMHNRVRMIVASFLVKDLHINWQWGEEYFMQRLIDGSFPANNGGWQWSAGTGTDAAPYFRVFNPTSQGEKFDPDGNYIRKWVEELRDVPSKHIHNPHAYLKQQGMFAEEKAANETYPKPIVDHKQAREVFISTFKQVKNNSK